MKVLNWTLFEYNIQLKILRNIATYMDYSPQAKSEDMFLPLAKSAVVLAGKGDVKGREGASPLVSER